MGFFRSVSDIEEKCQHKTCKDDFLRFDHDLVCNFPTIAHLNFSLGIDEMKEERHTYIA